MNTTSNKIQRGMTHQLQTWRALLANGHKRMGWKIGFNIPADQQRMHLPSAMIGYLSSEHAIASGGAYKASPASVLLIEPEVAVLMGRDVDADATPAEAIAAIAAYSAALELVDTTRSVTDDIEAILSGNMFHEGVILSEQRVSPSAFSRSQLSASLKVNTIEVRTLEQQRVPQDFSLLIITAANILAEYGERLQAGDWIITGAAAPAAPVKCGDDIFLDMGFLGNVSLTLD